MGTGTSEIDCTRFWAVTLRRASCTISSAANAAGARRSRQSLAMGEGLDFMLGFERGRGEGGARGAATPGSHPLAVITRVCRVVNRSLCCTCSMRDVAAGPIAGEQKMFARRLQLEGLRWSVDPG